MSTTLKSRGSGYDETRTGLIAPLSIVALKTLTLSINTVPMVVARNLRVIDLDEPRTTQRTVFTRIPTLTFAHSFQAFRIKNTIPVIIAFNDRIFGRVCARTGKLTALSVIARIADALSCFVEMTFSMVSTDYFCIIISRSGIRTYDTTVLTECIFIAFTDVLTALLYTISIAITFKWTTIII